MLRALSNIKHDGTVYVAGDDLPSMTQKQMDALLLAGVAETLEKAKSKKSKAKAAKEESPAKEEVVDESPKVTWSKARLLDHARDAGVEVDQEMTRAEIYNAIKEAGKL